MNVNCNSVENKGYALQLRSYVKIFLEKIECDESMVYVPLPKGRWNKKPESPFHLRAEIFLQISGKCIFDFPAQQIVVNPGDVLVVPPGMPHKETAVNYESEEFCNLVYMLGDAVGGTVHIAKLRKPSHGRKKDNSLPYPVYMEKLAEERFYPVIGEELGVYPSENSFEVRRLRQMLLKSLLLRSLIDLEASSGKNNELYCNDIPPGNKKHYKALLAKRIINEHVRSRMPSVKELADAVKCTPNHLSTLFRQSTGETIKSYINNLKLEYARKQVETTTYNIAEIAWSCGFQDASYFSKIFKRRFGKNPEEVRGAKSKKTHRHLEPKT
jgi:AraC-like DNA-binding protein